MRRWYEEVWAELPEKLDPPDFEARRDFLVSHVRRGDRVLDLGCGDGPFLAPLLAAEARVTAADIADAALERARRRAPGADAYVRVEPHGPFPWEDGAFDLVWASEVIEHVADTEAWLNEVRRVLRPGGRLLVTTPNVGRLRRAIREPDPRGQHLRFYTRGALRGLLDDMGFDLVDVETGPRRLLLATAVT